MKKIIAIAAIFVGGITIAIAQTPAVTSSTTATDTKAATEVATPVTPAVNAADMSQPSPKCDAASTKKSCCSSGANRASAATNTTSTETTATTEADATEVKAADHNCQTVGFGMSAVKPVETSATEEKPKD